MAQPSPRTWSERIRRIKEELPIEVLIGQYFTLVRAGTRYLRTKEHDSLVIDQQAGRYFWNSRGESGDVIDFLSRQEGLSLAETLDRLDDQTRETRPWASASLKDRATPERMLREPHRELVSVMQLAVVVYHAALRRDETARAYLARRGIDDPTIQRLQLGFCRGSDLLTALVRTGLNRNLAVRAGLLKRRLPEPIPPSRRAGSAEREFLRGRIVIPEFSPLGPIWLIGRSLPGGMGPRYLGLSLPRPLLGYHRVRHRPVVLVVEGVFDLLTLDTWLLPGVALCGTDPGPLARAQLLELARSKRLVLIPQADLPGQSAMTRLAALLPEPSSMVQLPAGVKDLSELAEKPEGRAAFLRALPEDIVDLVRSVASTKLVGITERNRGASDGRLDDSLTLDRDD